MNKGLHLNYEVIKNFIPSDAHVLDLGCGDGTLMSMLKSKKRSVQGIDIDQENVIKCLEKGLSVIQGDMDHGLDDYADDSYDYVVLNQTIQSVQRPDFVVKEMLRVGKKGVVSFPNFANYKVRFDLFFRGKMPKSASLPFEWYNTPNIHLLTLNDFYDFADIVGFQVEQKISMTGAKIQNGLLYRFFDNFLTEDVIFIITKKN